MKRMNTHAGNIYGFPAYKAQGIPDERTTEQRRGWFFRRAVDLGVISMADSQPKQPGFYVNATTIIGFIIVAATIAGLFFYAVHIASESGYEKGKTEAERKALEIRLSKAEEDARRAKDLQTYNSGKSKEHEEEKK